MLRNGTDIRYINRCGGEGKIEARWKTVLSFERLTACLKE